MLRAIVEKKTEIAKSLARAVHEAAARQDTDHAAFHGCIDWHSAVHGMWALTAYTRMTGDRQYEPFIGQILNPGRIAMEQAFTAARRDFEMPYGRAWFLRLALEHERAFGSDILKPMADDILGSMLARYREHGAEPRRGSYDSDSWALINMHDYAVASGNGAALASIRDWVRASFVVHDGACDYALEAGHFMAVVTNWAWLVSRVLERDEFSRWERSFFARPGLPQPVMQPVNWHHHGLNFSRAWGLWGLHEATDSAASKRAYLAAYAAHFCAAYDDPAQWCGDYHGVGHWVPQFGMFALQPLFGADTAAIV